MKTFFKWMFLIACSILFLNWNYFISSVLNFKQIIKPEGNVIEKRFDVPEGYKRFAVEKNSFGEYLKNLPLKPHLSKVYLYNGKEKQRQDVHEAVIDLELSKVDLQQCADAIIRLRSEYLYKQKRFEEIHFNFTSGFNAQYTMWREGNRIKVIGNKAEWFKQGTADTSYTVFRQYLEKVFSYAGTKSLSKELKPVEKYLEMRVGDLLIMGGSPGHAVLIVDMAQEVKTGRKVFMMVQSYMPAQQIHVLKNFNDPEISPWYYLDDKKTINTPEWDFETSNLKRF